MIFFKTPKRHRHTWRTRVGLQKTNGKLTGTIRRCGCGEHKILPLKPRVVS